MRTLALVGLFVGPLTCLGIDTDTEDPALREARRIWLEECADCHGASGRGDGVVGARLDPPPPDFHDGCRPATVDTIRSVILSGGETFGGSAAMAPHHELEAKPEVLATLVEFIVALRTESGCPEGT